MKIKSLLMGAVLAVVAALSPNANAALTEAQRLTDFNQMVSIIERNYGPIEWKKETIGLDWGKHVAKYRELVAAANSDSKFYQLMAQFLGGLQDGHVSAKVPSTYRASLGFVCDYINGKVLIEEVDSLRLPEMLFPFKKGDQLLALGGVPVEKLMTEVSKINNTGYAPSQVRIAAARLTSRREASGLAVPKGVTTVTVLPRGASQPVTVTATWITRGLPIIELDDLSRTLDSGAMLVQATSKEELLLAKVRDLPLMQLSLSASTMADYAEAGVGDIGNANSMFKLPEGAKVYDEFPMTVASFEAAGKKIGLIRIPAYDSDDLLQNVARAVMMFEKETDVLVLDQTNNPGGSVSLVSNLITLFAKQSSVDMNFKVRASLKWLERFQEVNTLIGDLLAGDPNHAAANALKARFQYLEEEIRDSLAQRRLLTNPFSLDMEGAFGVVQPQPTIRYTKPVLLLINEFDFSGGDAFPALLKDNGMATLFGAQTSGAGGNVVEYGPLANSYFKFSLTESLMVRPNGDYMENRGVKPDIAYSVTESDFMNGYTDYVRAFTKAATGLAGVTSEQFEAWAATR